MKATDRRGDPLHVLLIHQAFTSPAEAGGTRHYELARRMVGDGLRFTIVASSLSYLTGKRIQRKPGLTAEQSVDDVRIVRAYTLPTLHRSYVWRVVSFLSFMLNSIVAGLRAGPVNIILGTSPPILQGISAWIVSLARRCPFVFEIRDLWPDFAIGVGVLRSPILIRLSRWLEGFLYARANHIIVNSPAYCDHLVRRGVSPAKVTLIPNGVDPEMFDPNDAGAEILAQFNLRGKFVVTYAGALGLANDIDCILRASQHLCDQPEIHFLLVGDGKERRRLEGVARKMRLANVTFAGPVAKARIPGVLAASNACVATLMDIPMFRMTYPNKVFDYMAAARPVVLGIDGVIREVVESADAGIFVQPGNDRGIADAILRLKRNVQEGLEMGRRGRDYVMRHFDRDLHARRFEDLLVGLVEKER